MGKNIILPQNELIHRAVEEFKCSYGLEDGSMKRDDILETLADCGLNEYESKVYSSLVRLGVSKASRISESSDVPQSKIYEVLDQLMNKQLVEMFDGRPKEYKATSPEVALKNMLNRKSNEIDELKKRIDEMSDFLKPRKKSDIIGGIWTIKGEKFREFFNKASEMLDRSEKYVYAITKNFSRSYPMAVSSKECLKRGVKIRVIGMEKLDETNYYRAMWYKKQGIDLRCFETKVHPRIIVVDGRELLLRLDHSPHKKNKFRFNSLWSEDPSLVTVMDNYVKHMWENSDPLDFSNLDLE